MQTGRGLDMKISRELLQKYNVQGPRYTSYPPANFFSADFGAPDFEKALQQSNNEAPENISLYIHIPFCTKRCLFCGCNTHTYPGKALVKEYIDAVIKEIVLFTRYINTGRKVTQIHFGGGTPNAVSNDYILQIMEHIRNVFSVREDCEIAVEWNPAYIDFTDVDFYLRQGFNRFSLGVQDFNEEVLKAVNRDSSKIPVNELVGHIKQHSGTGVNLDFIYGLPLQTAKSFLETIRLAVEISPDRLVTFSYAHLPALKKHQHALEKYHLPDAAEKLQMLTESAEFLTGSGYVAIGMDHYAKPSDELAVAQENKALHRNFQGYCPREKTGQVYAFGVTSISQMHNAYGQNTKDLEEYMQALNRGVFAVNRGYHLTFEDTVCREVINTLMCNKYLDFRQTAGFFDISVDTLKQMVGFSPEKLSEFEANEFIAMNDNAISVTSLGSFFIRNIAMAFDPRLGEKGKTYSKTV